MPAEQGAPHSQPGYPHPGLLPAGQEQSGGEWWQTPGTHTPVEAGYAQSGVEPRHRGFPGARSQGRASRSPGGLLDRVIVVLAGVLAGYAVMASVVGFKANTLFPGNEWMSARIIPVTVAHVALALLWLVATVLLLRRTKAVRVMVAVLAVGNLGMNVVGVSSRWWDIDSALSVFTGSVDYVCLETGWYGCPPYGEDAGLRFTGAGAVLAALMLVLLLISAIRMRGRREASAQLPAAGQPGRSARPEYPYR